MAKGSRDTAEKILATGSPKKFSVELTDFSPGASFEIEIVDKEHGFALKAWQKMGSPEPPTREQTQILKSNALNTKKEQVKADSNGVLQWEQILNPWTVALLKEI